MSAMTGEGATELLLAIGDRLRSLMQVVDLSIPFERGDVLAAVYRLGEVLTESADQNGMRLRARLDDAARAELAPWVDGSDANCAKDDPRGEVSSLG